MKYSSFKARLACALFMFRFSMSALCCFNAVSAYAFIEEVKPKAFALNYDCDLDFIKKPLHSFFETGPTEKLNSREAETLINELGSEIPNFSQIRNANHPDMLVIKLMHKTASSGFRMFGLSGSTQNKDVRTMFVSVLRILAKAENRKDAKEQFERLIEAHRYCQQAQYRALRELYFQLRKKPSLLSRVAVLVDEVKKKWLMQTIAQLSRGSAAAGLDAHLENRFLQIIGDSFGLAGAKAAKEDGFAYGHLDKNTAITTFQRQINHDDILAYVWDDFVSNKDELAQAEIYQWVVSQKLDPATIYDEDGLVTKEGSSHILASLTVFKHAYRSADKDASSFGVNDRVYSADQKKEGVIIDLTPDGNANVAFEGVPQAMPLTALRKKSNLTSQKLGGQNFSVGSKVSYKGGHKAYIHAFYDDAHVLLGPKSCNYKHNGSTKGLEIVKLQDLSLRGKRAFIRRILHGKP